MSSAPSALRRFRLASAAALVLALAACAPPALVFVNSHYNPAAVRRVAIIDFDDHPSMVGSGKIVSGIFEKYLFLSDYTLIDRRQVSAMLQQLNIQPTDNLDLDTIRYLGSKLQVDALIFGQVTDYTDTSDRTVVEAMTLQESSPLYTRVDTVQAGQNGMVRTRQDIQTGVNVTSVDTPVQTTEVVEAHVGLSLRMVNVNTGEVLWSASASAQGPHLNDASETVSAQIIHALNARLKNSAT